jgi:hypothetical protein
VRVHRNKSDSHTERYVTEPKKKTQYPNFGLQLRGTTRQIVSTFNRPAQSPVDGHPVRAPEQRTRTQERERIILGTGVVDDDIPQHIFIDLLREVNTDAKEVCFEKYGQDARTDQARPQLTISLCGLNFREDALKPPEGWGVAADPEKFHALKGAKTVLELSVIQVFENRCERGNTYYL